MLLHILLVPVFYFGRGSILVTATDAVRAVNLGGWLVVEGWMTPESLFKNLANLPNGDILDGAQIQLQSAASLSYVQVQGNQVLMSSNGRATFRIWRLSSQLFQLREIAGNNFLQAFQNGGSSVNARAASASNWETFTFSRGPKNKVHIMANDSIHYLQVKSDQLTADYEGQPSWDDSNPAVFYMSIVAKAPLGEFQLSNAYDDRLEAMKVLQNHRNTFITRGDFAKLVSRKINTVRIPVGWWIKDDPNPPPPFVAGSLAALDNAFQWAMETNIKIIIDLHAAPGAQSGEAHSGTRDGTFNWDPAASLKVIDFLARKYSKYTQLLGIELLNEPSPRLSPQQLKNYYDDGYKTVRSYSQELKVVLCQVVPQQATKVAELMPPGASNVVLDVHLYTAFNDVTVADAIRRVNTDFKPTISSLNRVTGAQTFVGEWANVLKSSPPDADYNALGKTQLDVFSGASFGWAYWSFRNHAADKQWSFERGVVPYP